MTCDKSDRVAARCHGCGEYQMNQTHIVVNGNERTLWGGCCCPVCAPHGAELTGEVRTVAGEQAGLFDAADVDAALFGVDMGI